MNILKKISDMLKKSDDKGNLIDQWDASKVIFVFSSTLSTLALWGTFVGLTIATHVAAVIPASIIGAYFVTLGLTGGIKTLKDKVPERLKGVFGKVSDDIDKATGEDK